MSLTVIVPTWTGDEDKALALFRWIAELGRVDTKCYILCSHECRIGELVAAAQSAFTHSEHILDHINRKSNWSSNDPGARDASGPNSMFEQAAWFMHMPRPKGPWLWLEPDCRPLTRDWFTVLQREYEACGKPVMGDLITTNSPHMSGVAIYPDDVPQRFPKMVFNVQRAFDVADSVNVIEQAHVTKRIQDCFRTETWNEQTFSRIRPEAVLFCGTKNDDLLPFLRNKLGIAGVAESGLTVTKPGRAVVETLQVDLKRQLPSVGSNPTTSTPIVDIFIKSYPADYELLNYALKSIAKFATGFRNVIVVIPDNGDGIAVPPELKNRYYPCVEKDKEPGYAWQQVVKLTAGYYTNAEYIWFHDSDTILTRPVDASELFINGRPYWLKTPYGNARADQHVWIPIQEAFVGKRAQFELMRRHDFLVHRSWLEKLRDFCEIKHDQTIEQYIMGKADPKEPLKLCFSEFNVLGHFLHERHHDLVSWVDTTKDQVPPEYCFQSFTHGGRQRIDDDIAKFKQILGEGQPQVQELEKLEKPAWMVSPEKTKNALESAFLLLGNTTPIEESFIWSALANEAIKSPGHKGRIVRKFNSVMAAVKPKMPEGFGKGRKKTKVQTPGERLGELVSNDIVEVLQKA